MKYIVREISSDWQATHMYLSQIDVKDCQAYEIILSKNNIQSELEVVLTLANHMNDAKVNLFYLNSKRKLLKVKYKQENNTLKFITNKNGIYVVIRNIEKYSIIEKMVSYTLSLPKLLGIRGYKRTHIIE